MSIAQCKDCGRAARNQWSKYCTDCAALHNKISDFNNNRRRRAKEKGSKTYQDWDGKVIPLES